MNDSPWLHEPNSLDGIDDATGYRTAIRRHEYMKTLNGYVGVPRGHRLYNVCYMDVDIDGPHGGLTFAGKHWPLEIKDVWWFGFDCAHAGDYIPGGIMSEFEGVYRDIEFVKEEVRLLAKALKAADL